MFNFLRNITTDRTATYGSLKDNKDQKKALCSKWFCFLFFLNLFIISNVIGYVIGRYSVNPNQFTSMTDSLNFVSSNISDTVPPIHIESIDSNNSDQTQLSPPNINIENINPVTESTNINILFNANPLDTNLGESELKKLIINVDMITVNENNGLKMTQNGPYYGAYSFKYKYPANDEQTYNTNQIRRECYHIKFESQSTFENVIIDIKFDKFQLERGFDRIIIRNFNDSEVDIPQSFTGHHIDLSKTYLLEQSASKTLCIEFQSDESITDYGYEYAVNIYYDACQWSPYDQCFMRSTIGQRWSRGPFFNGKCGVGIMSKHRGNTSNDNVENMNGILQCSDNILETYGPEYCVKRKCVDWNNTNDPDFPPIKRPLRNWFRFEEYYNGRGRLDPSFSDPFRIYRASENNLINPKNNKIDLDILEKKLELFAEQIASEHYDENVLKYAILDREHRNITAEYIGARTLHSLINGRPMVIATVGDSVTSGHDNMFMSTYAMQAQSRLRPFFSNIGNKGAAFIARNIGVGGGPDSSSQGWVVRSLATETFPSLFSKLNDIINSDNNYNIWYKNSGIISNMDIFLWEQYFCKTSRKEYIELDIRQVATMNSIWAAIVPNRGIRIKNTCKPLDQLLGGMPSWNNCDKYGGYLGPIVPKYLDKMGFGLIMPEYGMRAACDIIKNGTKGGGWKKSDDGEGNICCIPDGSPNGQLYSYVGYWMRTNWHPNSRGNRVNADMVSYWIINSAITFLKIYKDKMLTFSNLNDFDIFLKDKSGNWGSQIVKSIMHQKYDEFIEPELCGPICKSIPFALTNEEPSIYNTHHYLNEYILFNVSLTPTWQQHIESIGWEMSGMDQHSIVAKIGYEGKLDTFRRLQPIDKWYKNKYEEWKIMSNINECCDEFEKYLISKKYYLQIVVKIPLYGVGNINVFGDDFRCGGWHIKDEKIHIYVNKLEVFMENNNELGVMLKNENCTFGGLESGLKYVITYVPYNISQNVGSFKAMFVSAY